MTKKRLLPETDLARFALLSENKKRIELKKFREGYAPWSYAPFRKVIPEIFNAKDFTLSFPDSLPKCSLNQIENAITELSSSKGLEQNLQVTQALYNFVAEKDRPAFKKEFMPVSIGYGAKLKLWHDFYFDNDGLPVICYMDPRRGSCLTELARKFVFSVMYHNLALEDFSEAQFQIFNFPESDNGKRRVEVHQFNKKELVDEDDINESIDHTYKIWHEILEERKKEVAPHIPDSGDLFA